jgi:hypothetical protein
MRIRTLAMILLGISVFFLLMDLRLRAEGMQLADQISHIAHLGGAAAAAVWFWVVPRFRGSTTGVKQRLNQGAWQRKMDRMRKDQEEIDRILAKINRQGLDSLTSREKRTLKEASKRQAQQDRDLHDL